MFRCWASFDSRTQLDHAHRPSGSGVPRTRISGRKVRHEGGLFHIVVSLATTLALRAPSCTLLEHNAHSLPSPKPRSFDSMWTFVGSGHFQALPLGWPHKVVFFGKSLRGRQTCAKGDHGPAGSQQTRACTAARRPSARNSFHTSISNATSPPTRRSRTQLDPGGRDERRQEPRHLHLVWDRPPHGHTQRQPTGSEEHTQMRSS